MDRDKELKLIETWRERPCLFETDNKFYANRTLSDKTFSEIWQELEVDALSGSAAKASTGHQQRLKSNVTFFNDFPRKCFSECNVAFDIQEDSSGEGSSGEGSSGEGSSEEDMTSAPNAQVIEERTPRVPSKKRRRGGDEEAELFRALTKKITDVSEDKDVLFGKSIGYELKEVPEGPVKGLLKTKILELVHKAKSGVKSSQRR